MFALVKPLLKSNHPVECQIGTCWDCGLDSGMVFIAMQLKLLRRTWWPQRLNETFYAKVQEKHDVVDRKGAAQQKKEGAAVVRSQNKLIKMLIINDA